MPNMDYCKYFNTAQDLRDLFDEGFEEPEGKEEQVARQKIIAYCVDIALDFGDEVGRHVVEGEES